MRRIKREELNQISASTVKKEEISENTILKHSVFEEEFSCNECGSPVYIRQDPKGYDATLGCLNPECDNKAIMR